jgi:hypothetical protein
MIRQTANDRMGQRDFLHRIHAASHRQSFILESYAGCGKILVRRHARVRLPCLTNVNNRRFDYLDVITDAPFRLKARQFNRQRSRHHPFLQGCLHKLQGQGHLVYTNVPSARDE